MIGGADIIIKVRLPRRDALRVAINAIVRKWPSALIQNIDNSNDGQLFSPKDKQAVLRSRELMIYKDQAAFEKWTAQGAIPSNANTMIHIIWRKQDLTLVVDNAKTAEIKGLLASLRRNLRGWPAKAAA